MQVMNNITVAYHDLGLYEVALEKQELLLTLRQRELLPDHPDIAQSMSNLGMTYRALGMHEDALRMQHGALAIYKRVGADPAIIARVMFGIGGSMSELGDIAGAISFTLNAMGVLQQGGYPPDHPTAVNFQKGLENLLSLDRS
jgi:tetratricopeptide (TPR) repeat protein